MSLEESQEYYEMIQMRDALQEMYDATLTEETDSSGDMYVTMSFTKDAWFEVCETWRKFCNVGPEK